MVPSPSDHALLGMLNEMKESEADDADSFMVDDLMAKYDNDEKKEQQNVEFINVLKQDDKILNYFIANYNPGLDEADDEKYIAYEFSKFSEPGWSQDGKPLNKQVLGKKKAKAFVEDILMKWKGFELDEDAERGKQKAEAFIAEGGKFENAWRKFDESAN